jgi:hypothetical protein
MSIPFTEQSSLGLFPGRGIREFSTPAENGNPGISGIHFNMIWSAQELILGIPPVSGSNTGTVYFSTIHGGLGSDAINPLAIPTTTPFNPNVPAFPNPDITGYYAPGSPLSGDPVQDGFINTEKLQRGVSDNATNKATIQQTLNGRNNLNCSLWISDGNPGTFAILELYRDLNPQDKVAGSFGPGDFSLVGQMQNAQLLAKWTAETAARNQNQPNFNFTNYPLPAGTSLYMIFRNNAGAGNNLVVGSMWFS